MDKKENDMWARHLEEWEQSGLTQAEYCNQEKIKYRTFKNRIWRLKNKKKPATFHEVKIAEEKKEPLYCEIRFSKHESIKIEGKNTLSRLTEILTGLNH